jgi:tetratricopeptide (TPR) repeat protein
MKKFNLIQIIVIILYCTVALLSCSKSAFLDTKPQTNLVVPTTISDLQAIIENDGGGSVSGLFNITPALGEASSDNYYLQDNYFQSSLTTVAKNVYTWATDIFSGVGNQIDWNKPYAQILNTNIAIEGLQKIEVTNGNQQAWNNAYGDALFKRAYAFWNLAQIFCAPYDSSSAKSDLGLPLKLSSDVNQSMPRSTLQETYDRILSDLVVAVRNVPLTFAGHLNRGSKAGVFALLARVYMSMGNYTKAGLYADSSLQLYSGLIDYNTVSTSSTQPFLNTNDETIYQSFTSPGMPFVAGTSALPDSNLYRSYTSNDLRGQIFFRTVNGNASGFKYGYEGNLANYQFTGITSSEMYLIRAECYARQGNTNLAMDDLNYLLKKRWKSNNGVSTFIPFTATSSINALSIILTERRKELIFRGLRWMDIRRLNKEGYAITPKRLISGQTYTLSPNSSFYTLPIPPDEIALSGIQQNKR